MSPNDIVNKLIIPGFAILLFCIDQYRKIRAANAVEKNAKSDKTLLLEQYQQEIAYLKDTVTGLRNQLDECWDSTRPKREPFFSPNKEQPDEYSD